MAIFAVQFNFISKFMKPYKFIVLLVLSVLFPSGVKAQEKLICDFIYNLSVDYDKISASYGSTSPEMADFCMQAGYRFNDIDFIDYAGKFFEAATQIIRICKGEDSAEYGYSLCVLGTNLIRKREYDNAAKILKESLPIITNTVGKEHPYYATWLLAKATLDYCRNSFQSALHAYRTAIKIYNKYPEKIETDPEIKGFYVSALIMCQYIGLTTGKSSDDLEKTIHIIDNLYANDKYAVGYADALYMISIIYLKQRIPYMAYIKSEKALDILAANLDSIKTSKYVDFALNHVNILQMLRAYLDSDILTSKIIDYIGEDEKLNPAGELGTAYLYKAMSLLYMNRDFNDSDYYSGIAAHLLDKAANITGDKTPYYTALWMKAESLIKLERFVDAAAIASKCWEEYPDKTDMISLDNRINYGLTYAKAMSLVNIDKAVEIYEKVYDLIIAASEKYPDQTWCVSKMITHLVQVARLYQDKYAQTAADADFQTALKAWKYALDGEKGMRPYNDSRTYSDDLAALYALHGDWVEALEQATLFYNCCTEGLLPTFYSMSTYERNNWWGQISKLFDKVLPLIALECDNQQATDLLYNAALISKSMLLSIDKSINEIVNSSNDEKLKSLYDEYLKAGSTLTRHQQLGTMTDAIRRRYTDAGNALMQHPEMVKRTSLLSVTNWETLSEVLREDEAAVEFIAVDHKNDKKARTYCALVLRHAKHPKLINLPKVDDNILSDQIDFKRIYDYIWRPLEKELTGTAKIYFSPAGIIHALPVEHFTGKDTSKSYIRLSSTRELAMKTQGAHALESAELFGGLTYDAYEPLIDEPNPAPDVMRQREVKGSLRAGVAYLPATLDEVLHIKNQLDKRGCVVALHKDMDGSESKFKSMSGHAPSLIHIASHGFYYSPDKQDMAARSLRKMFASASSQPESDKAMLRTGLFLSGANYKLSGNKIPNDAEDGILTAKEISTMDLSDTQLVVLSACQSGLGDVTSEGVFGMSRAFKKAGAKSIVMSLWKVDDRATSILMNHFYNQYLSGCSPTEAIKYAQAKLRETPSFADPHYWAAFVIIDDI